MLIKGALFLVILVFLFFKKDYLPPRTPLKIARIQSGLDIPKNVQIIEFEEEFNFTGEGFNYILLKLNKNNLHDIIKEIKKENFKKLTRENLVKDGHNLISLHGKDINSIKNGFYKIDLEHSDEMCIMITIVDLQKKEIIVYTEFP